MVIESRDSNNNLEPFEKERSVRISSGEIDSRELFQSDRELKIRHGDDVYRLRRTGLNKLILTK
jgi:hemin uptake protein HemP